jgi:hypothetical protein
MLRVIADRDLKQYFCRMSGRNYDAGFQMPSPPFLFVFLMKT